MQAAIGWVLLIFGGAMYLAQVISSINFKFAQQLGIQENPEATDKILQRSEKYTAYWDLVTLWCLPLAGFFMIIDHNWWPIVALIGGAIYLDTSGREAAKNISFRHEGIRVGSEKQKSVFFWNLYPDGDCWCSCHCIFCKRAGIAIMNTPMIRLPEALSAWGTPDFTDILKKEIEQLDVENLPLQHGLSTASYATDNNLRVMIISVSEQPSCIRAKAGIFYSGVIAGCSCADDPTPVDEQNEYCEVQVDINKTSAETTIALLTE